MEPCASLLIPRSPQGSQIMSSASAPPFKK